MELFGKLIDWVADKVKKVWRWVCQWVRSPIVKWVAFIIMIGAIIWAAAGTATVVLAGVTIPTGAIVFFIALIVYVWSWLCDLI